MQYFNIFLEAFCLVIVLLLILFQLAIKNGKKQMNHLFLVMLILHALTLTFDIIFRSYEGHKSQYLYYLSWILNYLVENFGILLTYFFIKYLVSNLNISKNRERTINNIALMIVIVTNIFLISSVFNNSIFYITNDNIFKVGSLHGIVYILGGSLFFMAFALIIHYKENLKRSELITLLTYVLIPGFALIINSIFPKIMLTIAAITISLLIIFINIQIQQEKRYKQLELELLESRISIMLSQIQPHFLYNSLSAIDDLCHDNSKAHEAIITFSEYLRINLDSLTEKRLIPFIKELEHTKQYLWLEKLRFENKLNIVFTIEVYDFKLPALTLQPLVENAVKYGIAKKISNGTININTREDDSFYYIEVVDNGIGYDVEQICLDGKRHIGINNVRERLTIMCNGKLDIKSTIGVGTNVTIIIPKMEE